MFWPFDPPGRPKTPPGCLFGSLLAPLWFPLAPFGLPLGSVWLPLAPLWLSFGSLWAPFGSLRPPLARKPPKHNRFLTLFHFTWPLWPENPPLHNFLTLLHFTFALPPHLCNAPFTQHSLSLCDIFFANLHEDFDTA